MKSRTKERWRKRYKHILPKPAKFTYRGDGMGKIEVLVDGRPLFKTGPVEVNRVAAKAFVDHMNSFSTEDLREFGQVEAAKFINEVERGEHPTIEI